MEIPDIPLRLEAVRQDGGVTVFAYNGEAAARSTLDRRGIGVRGFDARGDLLYHVPDAEAEWFVRHHGQPALVERSRRVLADLTRRCREADPEAVAALVGGHADGVLVTRPSPWRLAVAIPPAVYNRPGDRFAHVGVVTGWRPEVRAVAWIFNHAFLARAVGPTLAPEPDGPEADAPGP